jgi:hypothetical protein
MPTLLFNPALQGRSLEPAVRTGNLPARHTLVLGQAGTRDRRLSVVLGAVWAPHAAGGV